MQHISIQQVKEWERFYRANFINSLSGFKSASLIGTVNEAGLTNLAIFSNIVHIGADPALIGFINRPTEAAPHTIANIRSTRVYTINHIHEEIISKAHQTSAKYAQDQSEFDAVGLTAVYRNECKAPFVEESRISYALRLQEIIPIALNNTFLIIGAVEHIYLSRDIVATDGFIEIEKAGSICSLGIDGYYRSTKISRYTYAKPGAEPTLIKP